MVTEDIPNEIIQKVLELYLCSDDPRIKHISYVLNIQELHVLRIIEAYTDNQISFEGSRFTILNSEINY